MILLEIYIVKSGDTLYQIANNYGVSVDELVFYNQLENPSVLSVGQALVIPVGESQNLGSIIVNGYITDTSNSTLNATLPYLTFMSPFSYRSDINGNLVKTFSVNIDLSRTQRVANLMTVTNLKEAGGFSSDIAHGIFTNEAVQDTFIGNVETVLALGGFYGVNVDFEYIYPFDRQSYNQFLARFTDRMHSLGYIVTTALAPKISDEQQGLLYSAHDYAFHGRTVDYVILMTYEWGYTYGPAMAVAPINMVRRVLNYATEVIPPNKIFMGVPNYGYNWTLPFVQGTAARAVSNIRAVTLAGEEKVSIEFDEVVMAPFFRYNDNEGRLHEVWFEDARSLQAKYGLVNEYGLGGISYWNLNTLFRTNFIVLESMYTIEKVL